MRCRHRHYHELVGEKPMSRRFGFAFAILLLVVGCNSPQGQSGESIEGVWRISEIKRDYESEANDSPLPSQIIFTKSHYSIVWMPGSEAIRAFEEPWEPSDAEILQRFWEVTVNTGQYQINGNQIRTEPVIARFPEFMGGYMLYDFKWSGSNLILTLVDEYTFDGVQAPWAADRSGQQHLTLSRVDD
jgi:hypothetical protein